MKTILFLGAAPTQLPPLVYALGQGHHVITCDNKPENPGHLLAHESFNVSTTDKEAVLELAKEKKIDGLVAYASDPAAPTVAYVAERLGLPGSPYESVVILSQKDKFRKFLAAHGFNTPRSQSFHDESEAREWLKTLTYPVYVKPIDSSGGKGISLLKDDEKFSEAFEHAKRFSREKRIVVEEEIPDKNGHQNDSDVFMVEGELKFWIWGDSRFDDECDPPFQSTTSFPKAISPELSEKVRLELERLLKLLGVRSGAFNVEYLLDKNGEVWFLEVGARNGGGRIGDTIKYATGIDLAKYTVDAALGLDCSSLEYKPATGCWAELLLHSTETGVLNKIYISEVLEDKVVEMDVWVGPGDMIYRAEGSNHALGTMILRFNDMHEMSSVLDVINEHLKFVVD